MRTKLTLLTIAGLLIALPALATAQAAAGRPGAGVMRPAAGAASVTAMLNARRVLELSPRQVAQLDSIERVLWAERQKLRAAAQPQRESMQREMRERIQRGERPLRDPAQRDSLRARAQARMTAMRPQMEALRKSDSTARAAAERVLNDTQRTKWREMQAERRGYERGRREGMRRDELRRGGRPAMNRQMQAPRRPR